MNGVRGRVHAGGRVRLERKHKEIFPRVFLRGGERLARVVERARVRLAAVNLRGVFIVKVGVFTCQKKAPCGTVVGVWAWPTHPAGALHAVGPRGAYRTVAKVGDGLAERGGGVGRGEREEETVTDDTTTLRRMCALPSRRRLARERARRGRGGASGCHRGPIARFWSNHGLRPRWGWRPPLAPGRQERCQVR